MPAAGSHDSEFLGRRADGGVKLLNESSFSLHPSSDGEKVEEGEESGAEDELEAQQQPRCHTGREIFQQRGGCRATFITCVVY